MFNEVPWISAFCTIGFLLNVLDVFIFSSKSFRLGNGLLLAVVAALDSAVAVLKLTVTLLPSRKYGLPARIYDLNVTTQQPTLSPVTGDGRAECAIQTEEVTAPALVIETVSRLVSWVSTLTLLLFIYLQYFSLTRYQKRGLKIPLSIIFVSLTIIVAGMHAFLGYFAHKFEVGSEERCVAWLVDTVYKLNFDVLTGALLLLLAYRMATVIWHKWHYQRCWVRAKRFWRILDDLNYVVVFVALLHVALTSVPGVAVVSSRLHFWREQAQLLSYEGERILAFLDVLRAMFLNNIAYLLCSCKYRRKFAEFLHLNEAWGVVMGQAVRRKTLKLHQVYVIDLAASTVQLVGMQEFADKA